VHVLQQFVRDHYSLSWWAPVFHSRRVQT
jgi:hypothetical protein